MRTWARQRQAIVITYIVLLALVGAAIFYFLVLFQPPSCFDGKQNGYEEGIDCGGGCQLVCPFAAANPNIVWSRAFEVADGVYNLAAEVENPNFELGTNIEYAFKGYDDKNVLVTEINDFVELYPTERKVIFQPAVQTGARDISTVFLEFKEESNWYKIPQTPKRIITKGYELEDEFGTPSLRADLHNTDVRPVRNITVVAVLYDADENIQQVSQTFVERIAADSDGEAFFSWRKPFENIIKKVEIFVVEPRDQ